MEVTNEQLFSQLLAFGHEEFRPGQKAIIRHLLAGRDVLAVLPTGAGKSLSYQLTAQLLPGVTVVVSPLIALMRDQIGAIEARGLDAGVVNSTVPEVEAKEALRDALRGESKLLYVTPERLGDGLLVARMRWADVSLFVVDEAHCISEWGHDFRPSYLALGEAAKALGRPPILALTATATPWVRDEIIEWLGMRDPALIVRGVDRPNLFLEVRRVEEESEDRRVLHSLLFDGTEEYPEGIASGLQEAMQGSGIVYTATTKKAEETAAWLRDWGIPADYYHGQAKQVDRERVQDQFMSGKLRVISATNAFGLGVDKQDVRFVIHRDVPGSLEAYYQEAGRAGRDGRLARCALIYRPGDLSRAAFLSATGRLTPEDVARGRRALRGGRALTLDELAEAADLGGADSARLAQSLLREGLAEETRGRYRLIASDFDPESVLLAAEERRKAYERSRLGMMRGYAELDDCRRRYLLNYFGEETEERCGCCDADVRVGRDRLRVAVADVTGGAASPFAVGERVTHRTYGAGVVQRVAGDSLTVLFEESGYKTLATNLVVEGRLLKAA